MENYFFGDVRVNPITDDLQFFDGECWNNIYIIPDPKPFPLPLEYTEELNPSNYVVGAIRIDPNTGKIQIFSGKKWVTLPRAPIVPHIADIFSEQEASPTTIADDPNEAYERAKKAVADM